MISAPVGVYDSGLGGLTVLRRIMARLPNESTTYVADQANVPYGGRDPEEIRRFSKGITNALIGSGCKAIVVACNISTAASLPLLKEMYPSLPIIGVIEAGARHAHRVSQNRRIGVLATEGTVRLKAYTKALLKLDADVNVVEIACPQFVPLIEAGKALSSEALEASAIYLAPLREANVDTIILGCTHYPFLLPVLREVWARPHYIDPADDTVCILEDALNPTPIGTVKHLLTTTGDIEPYRTMLPNCLPTPTHPIHIAQAQWNPDKTVLTLPIG